MEGTDPAAVVGWSLICVVVSVALVLGPGAVAGATPVDTGGAPNLSAVDGGTSASALEAGTAAESMASNRTNITGYVRYEDPNGNLQPARQVTVKIRKDAVGGVNPKIAEATTNDDGFYEIHLDVANHESGWPDSDPTLHTHVQALTQNPAVNVVNFGQNLDTANGNTHTVNRERTVDRGDDSKSWNFTVTGQTHRRAFQVANWSLEAYRFTDDEMGWTRDQVRARYPAANDDNNKFKSPLEKFVIGSNDWGVGTRNTVHHEYGHAVMSGLYGKKGWQIPNYRNWGSHCRWSRTGRILAWYEGFAEFFEAAVNDDPDTDGLMLESHSWYDSWNKTNLDCPDGSRDQYDGHKIEGAVANVLWDLYDPANEPHDGIDGSLGTIFDAVDEKDNKAWGRAFNNGRTRDVHDFFIQYVDNEGRYEDVWRTFFEYGILKPDRFETGRQPGIGTTCPIHGYPCSKLNNDVWSMLTPNTSINASIHHRDMDTYGFDLKQEQRAFVNATLLKGRETIQNQSSVLDLYGYRTDRNTGFQGTGISNTTENGPHEDLVFTSKRAGTHWLTVDNETRGFVETPSLYNLTILTSPQIDQAHEDDDTRTAAKRLEPFEFTKHLNVSLITASTARYDPDYFRLDLEPGDRIFDARIRNAPGLNLTLADNTTEFRTVDNATGINTTTDPEGAHYFVVRGGPWVEDYELNVTTQRISQLYEENDRRENKTDLDDVLDLDIDPTLSGGTSDSNRGHIEWCTNDRNRNSTGGGMPDIDTPDTGGTYCSRHNWVESDQLRPGYSPHDPDWYNLSLPKHYRLNVSIPDERLGFELRVDGSVVANTSAGSGDQSLEYTAESDSDVRINVTGDEYVPVHDLEFGKIHEAARDRLEDNDAESTATEVPTASRGSRVQEHDLLKLAAGDVDYFAVDLGSGDGLNATVTHLESSGDVNLSLVAPDGSITYGSDLNAPGRQFGQTSGERKLRATLSASSSGRYYVKVNGSQRTALKYNLTINTTADGSPFGDGTDDGVFDDGDGNDFEIDTSGWNERRLITEAELEELERAIIFEEIGVKPEGPTESGPEPGPVVSVHGQAEPPESVPPLEQSLGSGDESQYLVVDHDESLEGSAQVRVSVEKETLEANGVESAEVSLFRHSTEGDGGGWEKVATDAVEEDEETVTYLGESDGLSVFSVGVADTSGGDDRTTAGDGTGFGVPVALLALLTAVFAVARRD